MIEAINAITFGQIMLGSTLVLVGAMLALIAVERYQNRKNKKQAREHLLRRLDAQTARYEFRWGKQTLGGMAMK